MILWDVNAGVHMVSWAIQPHDQKVDERRSDFCYSKPNSHAWIMLDSIELRATLTVGNPRGGDFFQ